MAGVALQHEEYVLYVYICLANRCALEQQIGNRALMNRSESNQDLFEGLEREADLQSAQPLEMPDADVVFYLRFFDRAASDMFFKELDTQTEWKQEQIKFYGRLVDLPRLTACYGDEGKTYTYSGITVTASPWLSVLLEIKEAIEVVSGIRFNSVLLNKYRGEHDSVAWHSDDESELGRNPIIGSVSFGQTRTFQFKHKSHGIRKDIHLFHGSYLLMKGVTQLHWLHRIPKQKNRPGERINLTFRRIQQAGV